MLSFQYLKLSLVHIFVQLVILCRRGRDRGPVAISRSRADLHVPHQLREVLQGGVVVIHVGERGVVSVDVESYWKELRHDAVVGDESRQT